MNSTTTIPTLRLQLFADGASAGADGGGDTGAAGTKGVTAAAALPQGKGVKSNPLAGVKYGIQEESAQDAAVQEADVPSAASFPHRADTVRGVPASPDSGNVASVAGETEPDRNAEFERLIKGEYKDLYDARVQDTVQKRLKNTRETVEKYEALVPTLEMLAKKYNVDAGDAKALSRAIEEDDTYYEQEALEKGITVQQLKEIRKMEKENAELKRQMQEHERQENAGRLYAAWMEQAEQARTVYPSFDLRAEMRNPRFVDLLRSNVDVRTAYEVLHKDEIIPAAMQFTAKTVEQKLANKIIAGGARPLENGMNAQSSAVVKSDVSQLSKADRQEIIRRVQRGERIRF